MKPKEYTDKKRIEFLNQDEKTLWQFVEGMVEEAYYKGIKNMEECRPVSKQSYRVVRNSPSRMKSRGPVARGKPRVKQGRCTGPNCRINQ